MKWNTFPHRVNPAIPESLLPHQYCDTERHEGQGIPATQFQLIWEPNKENAAQSIVFAAWFTCNECAVMLRFRWALISGG